MKSKIFLSGEKFLKWSPAFTVWKEKSCQFGRINLLLENLLNGKFYWLNVCHYGFKTQSLTWTNTVDLKIYSQLASRKKHRFEKYFFEIHKSALDSVDIAIFKVQNSIIYY